jgi:hypothetical protein
MASGPLMLGIFWHTSGLRSGLQQILPRCRIGLSKSSEADEQRFCRLFFVVQALTAYVLPHGVTQSCPLRARKYTVDVRNLAPTCGGA